MNALTKTAIALALGTALSGCQALHLPTLSFKSRPKVQAQSWAPTEKTNYASALEEGRFELQSGNLSAAAALFRIARDNKDTRADSLNGLGVVYAKLGRTDLANRYFQMAFDEQPENPKFAANLLRLQQRVVIDNQIVLEARMAAERASARGLEVGVASGQIERTTRNAGVARATRGMVFIKTPAELQAAPSMLVSSRIEELASTGSDEVANALIPEARRIAVAIPATKVVYPIRLDLDK